MSSNRTSTFLCVNQYNSDINLLTNSKCKNSVLQNVINVVDDTVKSAITTVCIEIASIHFTLETNSSKVCTNRTNQRATSSTPSRTRKNTGLFIFVVVI